MAGNRYVDESGYVRVLVEDRNHERCHGGYIAEHVLVMESALGRRLLAGENVHHRNMLRADNRLDNLELWLSAQPAGGRIEDLLAWAKWLIEQYG